MLAFLIKLAYRLMLFSLVLCVFGLYLFTTRSGLELSLSVLAWTLPGKLELVGLEGQKLTEFSFKSLLYHDLHNELRLQQGKLTLAPFLWREKPLRFLGILHVQSGEYKYHPANLNYAFASSKLQALWQNAKLSLDSALTLKETKRLSLHLELLPQQWKMKGILAEGQSLLNLEGKGSYKRLQAVVSIRGQQFPCLLFPQYPMEISPDLKLILGSSNLKFRGSVLIPKAQIKPQRFTKSVNLSDDVRFVNEKEKEPQPAIPLDMDIRLIMGEKVELQSKGLKGLLTGQLRLRKEPQQALQAEGELQIRQGIFNVNDKELAIEQGQLLYKNAPLDNPGLHIRAVRQFSNTKDSFKGSNRLFDFKGDLQNSFHLSHPIKVGIEVSGSLKSPQILLFSVPALSEADKLSLLLLGVPASEANQAGGQLMMTALSLLNRDNQQRKLLEQLTEHLGVDINVENSSLYDKTSHQDKNQTAVVVGKALSKRLYLSYNRGLTQVDNSEFILKYLLNQFFSLQVNASMAKNGIDILYSH
jgi:translocation and assembly module TamB